MVGERLPAHGGLDLGQQAADGAGAPLSGTRARARLGGRRAVLEAGSAPRLPGAWTFGDHGAVSGEGLFSRRKFDTQVRHYTAR